MKVKFNQLPSEARLWELFYYDLEQGTLSYKTTRRAQNRAGTKFNHEKYDGDGNKKHAQVKIDGKAHTLSRVIWKMVTGLDPRPGYLIDHRDLNIHNYRWENLREATHTQNKLNNVGTVAGLRGINERRPGVWRVRIKLNGKHKNIGTYFSLEEAVAARNLHASQMHGDFFRETVV